MKRLPHFAFPLAAALAAAFLFSGCPDIALKSFLLEEQELQNKVLSWRQATTGNSTGVTSWNGIACSADGSTIAAYVYDSTARPLYSSIDGGNSWSNRQSDLWACVDVSKDGSRIAAGSYNGYLSLGGGTGAMSSQLINSGWSTMCVSLSSDASRIALNSGGQTVKRSVDGGATWTDVGTALGPGCALSSDGKVLAVSGNATPYALSTTTDWGATWRNSDDPWPNDRYPQKVAISEDGDTIVVAAGTSYSDPEYLYATTDGGSSWSKCDAAGSRNWSGVACSRTGRVIVASSYGGYLYRSKDWGATWEAQTEAGSRNWTGVAVSADGLKAVACFSGAIEGVFIGE